MVRGLDGKEARAISCQNRSNSAGAERPERRTEPARLYRCNILSAAATIFLIACVNLANLMFARRRARIGEIAVRSSMGAARHQVVLLLGAEAFLSRPAPRSSACRSLSGFCGPLVPCCRLIR